MTEPLPPLVSTEWLERRLGRDRLVVVDASWYLSSSGRDAAAEYRAGHIPGAVFLDLDAASDTGSPLPHMLPPAGELAEYLSALGLSDEDDVIVYDGSGVNLSAPRLWWMLRAMGHPRAAVLDGGLLKWKRENRRLESGPVRRARGRFTERAGSTRVVDSAQVREAVERGTAEVVDMRATGRFEGTEPEPRPGIRAGHIPRSRNIPYSELVAEDGTVLPPEALRRKLEAAGVAPDRPVIATCGSGVSACALIHALHLLGRDDVALYDGAWTEWGARPELPLATGPAR